MPFEAGDCLELDELWSFVKRRKNKRWVWLALCRRTRQIVSYAIGCRGEKTCRMLWDRIPAPYKAAHCYSDVWDAYARVVPHDQLEQSKDRGPTNHIERFNCTIRQRMARLTRKSLSFSKIDLMHEAALQLFIHKYNTSRSPV